MARSIGIDYGRGQVNLDRESGIRYGVIPQYDILQAWADSSEAEYPCEDCDACVDSECTAEFSECEPSRFVLSDGEYEATQSRDDCDVFVLKSPYFTYAQFCSPCAPGACYLRNPVDAENAGNRCYCFGPDWFDAEYPCPYPVYRVDTGEQIYAPKNDDAE